MACAWLLVADLTAQDLHVAPDAKEGASAIESTAPDDAQASQAKNAALPQKASISASIPSSIPTSTSTSIPTSTSSSIPTSTSSSNAETEPSEQDYAELLLAVDAKRESVLAELDRMEFKQQKEIQLVMRELDAYWVSRGSTDRYQDHYTRVRKILEEVTLRPEYSNMDVILNQYKAILDDAKLQEICEAFTLDALDKIQSEQERFFTKNQEAFSQYADRTFGDAQDSLAAHVDRLIANQFPSWQQMYATLPLPEASEQEFEFSSQKARGNRGTYAILGLAVLVLSRTIRRLIVRKMAKKIAGRVVSRFIPYIGIALLAVEVVTAMQAKSKMEDFLRQTFIEEYKSMVNPDSMWRESYEDDETKDVISMRAKTQDSVRAQLAAWSKASRQTTEELLVASPLLENPNFKIFAQAQIAQGVGITALVKQLNIIYASFGRLCLSVPIDKLIAMKGDIADADAVVLHELADSLGKDLIVQYDEHGPEMLRASVDMGAMPMIDMVQKKQAWQPIYRNFRKYLDRTASSLAKSGFFLASEFNLPLSPEWTPQRFASLGANEPRVREMAEQGFSNKALANTAGDSEISEMVLNMSDQNQQLAIELAERLSAVQLARYRDISRQESLVNTYNILYEKKDWSPETFVTHIRKSDRVMDVFEEFGADGIDIWNVYVNQRSGTHQEKQLDHALSLYRKGAPTEICTDAANVGLASTFYSTPGGRSAFNILYPVLKNSPLLGRILLVAVFLGFTLFFIRLFRINRLFSRSKKKRA